MVLSHLKTELKQHFPTGLKFNMHDRFRATVHLDQKMYPDPAQARLLIERACQAAKTVSGQPGLGHAVEQIPAKKIGKRWIFSVIFSKQA